MTVIDFIGREKELDALEREYSKPGFGMFVLYGRRRVGKSTLIRRFISDKRAVHVTGVKSDYRRNVAALRASVPERYRSSTEMTPEDVLGAWASMSTDGRLVVVIDEYPYLANAFPSFSSVLQNHIDDVFSGCDVFIILCGSSIGAMEDGILGYESPLYGRRTSQMLMAPLTYLEAVPFLKGFDRSECLRIYSMVGGIPAYLLMFDPSKGIDRCIADLFLADTAFFRMEPEYMLREELRDPSSYSSVIAAMASGKFRLSEIADEASMDSAAASAKLSQLMRLHIVEKVVPYGEKSGRKTGYRLADNMFRFCYRFIIGSYVPFTQEEEASSLRRIENGMPAYMGHVFEDVCRTYTRRNLGCNAVGTWWGADPATRSSAEIDVVGCDIDDPDAPVLFGECKCTRSPVTIDILDDLMKASLLVRCRERRYVLFSAGGFSEKVVEASEKGPVTLVSMDDLYSGRRCARGRASIQGLLSGTL